MGKSKSITFGNESSGIGVEFVKSRRVIRVHGWFDHYCGIEEHEITLVDFCRKLGIGKRELLRVVRELEGAKE